jgi:CYTH domain-containing protein
MRIMGDAERMLDTLCKRPLIEDEVTDDPRYFNSRLVANPYRTW